MKNYNKVLINIFFKKNYFLFLILFLCSCVSVDPQVTNQNDELSTQETEAFLEEEDDEIFEKDLEVDLADKDEGFDEFAAQEDLEEKQAEGELEEIEDEFAEFIDEEEDLIVNKSNSQETESSDQEVAQEDVSEESEEGEITGDVSEILTDQTEAGEQHKDVGQLDTEGEPSAEETVAETIETQPEETVAEQTEITEEQQETTVEQGQEEGTELIGETQPADQGFTEEAVAEVDSSIGQITNIRYESNNIYIDSVGGSLSYRSRFNEATKQFIIEISKAVIVDQLKWPYIMKEFQSDFSLLQADQKTDDTVRVIVQMRPESSIPSIIQKDSGDGFIISSSMQDLTDTADTAQVQESEEGEQGFEGDENFSEESFVAEGSEESSGEDEYQKILGAKTIEEFLLGTNKFYGHPITLDIREANLVDIIYFLAEDTGINMIVSSEISEKDKISISLKEVPWDQALVLIMKHKKLGYIRRGNVVVISTLKEIQSERKLLEDMISNRDKYAQLNLEIVPIDYAKASEISKHVDIFKTTHPQSFIKEDTNNNFLIIRDTEKAIEKMKELISKLDRIPKQVMIAAKIVEVNESFAKNFGISWGLTGAPLAIKTPVGGIDILPAPLLQILPDPPDSGTIGSNFTIGFPSIDGLIGDLDAFLGLAETNTKARVLSSPRIVALNGQSATVSQSSESIAFSAVATQSGSQTQIQRSPISLNLSVTPNITNVNSIYMKISMTRSFEGARVGQGGSSAAPTFSRSANTEILINNGQTAVIGGIYESTDRNTILGPPILKYIPFVKWLFSKVNTDVGKTELLLFLTPRILPWEKIEKESVNNQTKTKFSKSS